MGYMSSVGRSLGENLFPVTNVSTIPSGKGEVAMPLLDLPMLITNEKSRFNRDIVSSRYRIINLNEGHLTHV